MSAPPLHAMQGRLVPPEPGRFQAFPPDRWELELSRVGEAGLAGIEWIWESYGADRNPLRDDAAIEELESARSRHGATVESMCADWFMERPLQGGAERVAELRDLVRRARTAAIRRIVLPCVDASSLRSAGDRDAVLRALEDVAAELAADDDVELHLETDLPPEDFAALLDRIEHPLVRANYDSGNSSGLGYDPVEEWEAYGHRIGSVHVKDRVRGGGTVPLGEGDADLRAVFGLMRERGWDRPLVLQVARGPEGDEVAWVRAAADQVRALWEAAS